MTVQTFRQSQIGTATKTTNLVDATLAAEVVVLDNPAVTPEGTEITVVKTDQTTNTVTIQDVNSTEYGVLDEQDEFLTLICDGQFWRASNTGAEVDELETVTNLGLFGDGGDGDRVIDDEQSLSDNRFYRNLTITETGILHTNGWGLWVSNICTVDGLLDFNGGDGEAGADGGAAAAGLARNYLGGSNAGGAGGDNDGAAGAAVLNSCGGGVGGQGGDGDPGVGESAGAATALDDTAGGSRAVRQLVPLITGESHGELLETGSGGGGGGGDGTLFGGGGAASGGYLLLCARSLVGTGTISANGGDGGPGDPAGDCGGGGGGGGGVVGVLSETPYADTLTVEAEGGVGGALGGTGTVGSDGEAGTVVNLYGIK
jgi:hypothetical protein